MGNAALLKYRAFLSYAHADKGWANWLHRRLEGFHLDADLAKKSRLPGPTDEKGLAKITPIFLDRGNFAGGSTLSEATISAIDASASLIVVCSPVSAGRPAVIEEVRVFKWRHPDRPVIPVIIAGLAPDCFPPPLRFAMNADGTWGETAVTVLGVDLREFADGRALGLAKVVSGLLGLADANDIYKREERRKRQSRQLWSLILPVPQLSSQASLASQNGSERRPRNSEMRKQLLLNGSLILRTNSLPIF